MTDDVRADVGRLTDGELRMLLRVFELSAASDEDYTPAQVAFLADLCAALRDVLSTRVWRWLAIMRDPAVPPDWVTAVAALVPPDDDTPLE